MNLPNKISIIRILAIPVFTAVFLLRCCIPYAGLIAGVIFTLAAVTDFLDGYIARRYGLVTNLGKLLDPVADKLLVAVALFLLVEAGLGFAPYTAVMAIVIVARELIVSAFRQVAAGAGMIMHADRWGKLKTIFQVIAIPVLLASQDVWSLFLAVWSLAGGAPSAFLEQHNLFEYLGFGILVFATALTVVSGVNYLVKNRHVLKTDGKEKEQAENGEKK